MPAESALTQVNQIGVETTAGTAVAASKLFQSMSMNPSAQVSNNMFRPAGQKFATVASVARDWTQFDTPGQPVYDEIVYPFSSILGAGTVTTPDAVNAPTVREWLFSPSSINADNRKTFTIEKGNASRARRAAYVIWNALNLDINRDDVTLGGTAMARALTEGITLTAAPTSIPLVPIVGSQFSLFSDATSAGLGNTKLEYGFRANWSIGDAVGGVWPIDRSLSSFKEHVETDPDPTLELTPQADAAGSAFLADLRAGTTRFLRLQAIGPVIATTFTYELRIDMAVKVREVADYSEEDGVYVLPFTFEIVHDGGWGRALQVMVRNTTAAL
jgi:hypothetical protein